MRLQNGGFDSIILSARANNVEGTASPSVERS